jgi:hypothetical protein
MSKSGIWEGGGRGSESERDCVGMEFVIGEAFAYTFKGERAKGSEDLATGDMSGDEFWGVSGDVSRDVW